jgi:filamentous hemagglutinin family protein
MTRRARLSVGCFWIVLAALAPHVALAQSIAIDGSLGPKARTLTGPNYTIGADLGKQIGGNLFQSFGKFGLSTGETANFTGPSTVHNIIGRVTTGNASSIDGGMQSSVAGVNLYLINPSGIVFGPNATVNVSGSFQASTADYVRMSDGTRFQAAHPSGSTFGAAPPAAFGFLTAAPSAIAVNGSTLGPVPGTLGLIGGPVTITGGKLTAPGGTMQVASVAGNGEVPVDPRNSAALTVTSFGRASITRSAILDVGGAASVSPGELFVRAGALTIDASHLSNNDNAGKIDVRVAGELLIQNQGSISSLTTSTNPAGDIAITAGSLTLNLGTISSSTLGDTNAGNIAIAVSGQLLMHTGVISSDTVTRSGNAGNIRITAGDMTITDFGNIGSGTFGGGNGGNIEITVAGDLAIFAPAGGKATGFDGISSQANPGSSGNAGNVAVHAGSLTMHTDGMISSETDGGGKGGDVAIRVDGQLSLDGSSDSLVSPFRPGIPFRTGITAASLLGGDAGSVDIGAGQIAILGGAQITSTASGAGAGGSVAVTTPGTLLLDGTNVGGAQIAASAVGRRSGPGGVVTIEAGSLIVNGAAKIASTTAGPSSGGDIRVTAGDILLSGIGPQITAQSTGSGTAGAVTVDAGRVQLFDGGSISTEAASANGGNIELLVGDLLYLRQGEVSTSVNGALGNGGNILIDGNRLVVDHGRIIAQAVGGSGGNIAIRVSEFVPSADSLVSATSQLGISGAIEILGPRVDLNGSLVVLPGTLREVAPILTSSCAARGMLPRSALTQGGRGGLPEDAELPLAALYLASRPAPTAAATGAEVIGPIKSELHLTMPCS